MPCWAYCHEFPSLPVSGELFPSYPPQSQHACEQFRATNLYFVASPRTPGRFLEPPKELPSTKGDNDDVGDVDLGDKDIINRDAFLSASGSAPGGTKNVISGFSTSAGEHTVRDVAVVGANKPGLIVISSPAAAVTTDDGNERDGGRGARAGSESDSDGEDDEVRRSQLLVQSSIIAFRQ